MHTPSTGHDRGTTAVEYGLIIGLIAIVMMGGVALLGSRTSSVLRAADCAVASANGSAAADCSESTAPTGEGLMLTSAGYGSAYWAGTTPWSSTDMTVSGRFTLGGTATGNRGYGIVVQGSGLTAAGLQSGYTFQVDPGAGGFVVKKWSAGTESQVGARVPFPPGFDPTVPQQVQVAVQGADLTATVGGQQVMTVTLPVAMTGTQYGVRTWYGSTVEGSGVAVR